MPDPYEEAGGEVVMEAVAVIAVALHMCVVRQMCVRTHMCVGRHMCVSARKGRDPVLFWGVSGCFDVSLMQARLGMKPTKYYSWEVSGCFEVFRGNSPPPPQKVSGQAVCV